MTAASQAVDESRTAAPPRRKSALETRRQAHPGERSQIARLGMWAFIASEVLFFGALLVAYAACRVRWPAGFAAAGRETDVVLGTLNTAILLTGSALAAFAVALTPTGRRRWQAAALWTTAALGVAFMIVKGIEYRHDWASHLVSGPGFRLDPTHLPPAGAEVFFFLYFVATAIHAVHLTIGIGVMAMLARRVGRTVSDDRAGDSLQVEIGALYWHFVDVVWLFLYPLLYLVGRSG